MYDAADGKWSDTALSSSIVINGKSTTLDLSGVRKLMLAGRSYIGTSDVRPVSGTSNSNDVMMGESITVKGTQLAYLLPPDVRPSLLLFAWLCHADFSPLLPVRRAFGISGFEEADGIRRSC